MISQPLEHIPLARTFREFAGLHTHGMTPLYHHLSSRIASDLEILDLASYRLPGQPAPNILFGAVHYILLLGSRHPLARYYGTVSGSDVKAPDATLYPHFRDFCQVYRDELLGLIRSRRTQTNEVNRCSLLLPAFSMIFSRVRDTPLDILEIGPSAGFNLNWQRYRYRYVPDIEAGPSGSELTLECDLRGETFPPILPEIFLPSRVRRCAGIELHPVDLEDPEAMLWLRALIWPEHLDRMDRLKAAIAAAQANPPEVIQGNALEILPDILETLPESVVPILFHTFVLYQFSPLEQERFLEILSGFGRRRRLYRVAVEWIGGQAPTIELDAWEPGGHTHQILGDCNPHGRWMAWR